MTAGGIMTTVANVVSNYMGSLPNDTTLPVDLGLRSSSLKYDDVMKKWNEIRNNIKWNNIVELSIDEIRKRISELYTFVNSYKEFFIVETNPVSSDMLRDHFERHFNDINDLIHWKVLRPRDAIKIAEYIYLYDCVYPHLSEDIITPKDYPDLKIRVLIIPDELYDWMFRLDCLWFKLLSKKILDKSLFEYIEKNKDEFLNRALKLKVFLPIPPKKLHESIPNIERLWLRKSKVDWKYVHEYLYRKVVSMLVHVLR